jgi:hypothetical protein
MIGTGMAGARVPTSIDSKAIMSSGKGIAQALPLEQHCE